MAKKKKGEGWKKAAGTAADILTGGKYSALGIDKLTGAESYVKDIDPDVLGDGTTALTEGVTKLFGEKGGVVKKKSKHRDPFTQQYD
jgi:hypothetical protein